MQLIIRDLIYRSPLKKMDSMRGRPAEDYPGWREEMHRLLELAKEVLNLIEREYPAS